jgi:hypothetical protein
MELKLQLTFACCYCQDSITALLACKGTGLDEPGGEIIAAVNVLCPACEQVCQLLFNPHKGSVREVRPYVPNQPIPEPSLN